MPDGATGFLLRNAFDDDLLYLQYACPWRNFNVHAQRKVAGDRFSPLGARFGDSGDPGKA